MPIPVVSFSDDIVKEILFKSQSKLEISDICFVKPIYVNTLNRLVFDTFSELAAFGRPSVSSTPVTMAVISLSQTSFTVNVSGLSIGQSYQLQSTTNLAATAWFTETNFVAATTVTAITNLTVNNPQKFYRVQAY